MPKLSKEWHDAGITDEMWYDIVDYPMAQLEASVLCSDLVREIRQTGGSRQRGEGVKLLKRIRQRYTEDFNRRVEEARRAKSPERDITLGTGRETDPLHRKNSD